METPIRLGNSWFINKEAGVSQVTEQWVKTNYPAIASSASICDVITYIEKKIETKNITPGVGRTLLGKLKDIIKDANGG